MTDGTNFEGEFIDGQMEGIFNVNIQNKNYKVRF